MILVELHNICVELLCVRTTIKVFDNDGIIFYFYFPKRETTYVHNMYDKESQNESKKMQNTKRKMRTMNASTGN